jgi:hypothetical protein
MAAFSSLALIGLGLAGGMAASRVLAPKPSSAGSTQQAQTPTTATPATATPPPSTSAASSDAQKRATQAAQRRRGKASGPPTSSTMPVRQTGSASPMLQPQTLIGY